MVVILNKDIVLEYFNKIKMLVFEKGLNDNGRKELWVESYNLYLSNPLYSIFGAGFASVIRPLQTASGLQDSFVVFHSTPYETITIGGSFGLVFLFIHFIEKYNALFKRDDLFLYICGIGYILVDLYGMIDNTYYMYYYMIPLVIIMESVDNANFDNTMNNSLFWKLKNSDIDVKI